MRGRHRAPRTTEETRLRHRLRVRRGVSILVVTLLATIPVGVSAAMTLPGAVRSASSNTGAAPAERSFIDRIDDDFGLDAEQRSDASKPGDTSVVDPAQQTTAVGVGVKAVAPVDPSCAAGPVAGSALAPPSVCAVTEPTGMNWSVFDPGNIIPDEIFYNTAAMDDTGIRDFIAAQGAGCTGEFCLKNLRVNTPDQPADQYCSAYAGGLNEDAAAVLGKVSRACGVNPQVMLVTLQKESGLLGRTDPTASTYDAAWGWHCPDTGPGGSANCDPAYAGFFNQAYGMAKQWSRYRVDPFNYNYRAGQTVNILWNVVESGCGSAPVTIENTATASLYNYTPYQPNAAALASYPGTGDACSAYGNRNFFFLFGKYFGDTTFRTTILASTTGGGVTARVASLASTTEVTIPNNRFVDPALAGQVITAPTASVATGLAAGFAALGLPYVWGGGGSGEGPNNGCARGGGALNSCGSEIGFDCSGLTAFVLGRAGYAIPGDSSSQRAVGTRITWDKALPGDVVGFPGHVAIYLGAMNGVRYILEASTVGTPVHIVKLTRSDADPQVYRFWAGIPQIAASGSTFVPASPWSTSRGTVYISTIPRYFAVAPSLAAPPAQPAAPAPWPAAVLPAPTVAPPATTTVPASDPPPLSSATAAPTTARPTTTPVTTTPPSASSSTSTTPAGPGSSSGSAPSTTSASSSSGSHSSTATAPSSGSTTTAPTTDEPTTGPPATTAGTSEPTTSTTAGPEITSAAGSSTSAIATLPAATTSAAPVSAPPASSAAPAAPASETTSALPTPTAPASCPATTAVMTTESIPTAPTTPPLLPKPAKVLVPAGGSTLFMTAIAAAIAATLGPLGDPLTAGQVDGSCG